MNQKEKAKGLFETYKKVLRADNKSWEYEAKQCALTCVDEKFNGIIYVLGELKARGELSEKMYLKAITDLNREREEIKQEIKKS